MSLNAITRLAIAELIIYLILLPIVIFILIKHGRRGFEGWGFLIVFCVLRLTSSGIQIGDSNSTSTTGAIINSVGISAILLALSGVIHEA
jgi:prolipoprotein diacylglyceryltransferase